MSDEGQRLTNSLPSYFPSGTGSRNYKLLEPIGKQIESLEVDIETLENNTKVQTAESVESLFEIAKLVGVVPRQDESREQYRSRVISGFQLNTSRGTAEDLITTTATVLNIDPRDIAYQPADENGVSIITLPTRGLRSLNIDESEFINILQQNTAAGYRLEMIQLGTFEYISAEDYDNGDHESEFGFDGLDENGNPLGEGGTYAGTIG